MNDILYHALMQRIYRSRTVPGRHKTIEGTETLDKVINIDQSPIGRTPRSNPATYTGVFDKIRTLFAKTQEAKVRGYLPGRFSFNVKGGRCEACSGDGTIKIEMHFLPDVYVPCEVCKGARYNRDTLDVTFKGKNIAEVLDLSIEEAVEFFTNQPTIARTLQTLFDVGLGYVRLGQPAPTLSGGEAQRVKLASELGKRSTGSTIYILDEPTTGLHFEDVRRLLGVLAPPRRRGQHGARHRAQPRRDQVGRLDRRPRSRGRRRRRRGRRRGHARAGREAPRQPHRPLPRADPRHHLGDEGGVAGARAGRTSSHAAAVDHQGRRRRRSRRVARATQPQSTITVVGELFQLRCGAADALHALRCAAGWERKPTRRRTGFSRVGRRSSPSSRRSSTPSAGPYGGANTSGSR